MSEVVYRVVEHDGGWAYQFDGVYSETFATRAEAEAAANRVAEEQRLPGEDETVEWQDEKGEWHEERERGSDRPLTSVAGSDRGYVSARAKEGADRSVHMLLLAAGVIGLFFAMTVRRRSDI